MHNKVKRVISLLLIFVMFFGYSGTFAYEYGTEKMTIDGRNFSVSNTYVGSIVFTKVISDDGTVSNAVFNRDANTLVVDGKSIDIRVINNVDRDETKTSADFDGRLGYITNFQLINTSNYVINIVGLAIAGIVAAICAVVGLSALPNVLVSMISSGVADNTIKVYISVKVHTYLDKDSLYKQRPNYFVVREVFAGQYFNRLLLRF